MKTRAWRAEPEEILPLRELFRDDANCQLIRYSFVTRNFTDSYLLEVDGRLAGYGVVANKYYENRIIEFYVFPRFAACALPALRELIAVSDAKFLEAQTNLPQMLGLLYDCATNIKIENILFADHRDARLSCPEAIFRRARPEETLSVFEHLHEPVGDWVIELGGEVVATGGFLTHYNPPYADIFMEVSEPARRKGIGSYLVQELKRACYEAGKKPAARCDPHNVGSRLTMQRAGMTPCARMLAGEIVASG